MNSRFSKLNSHNIWIRLFSCRLGGQGVILLCTLINGVSVADNSAPQPPIQVVAEVGESRLTVEQLNRYYLHLYHDLNTNLSEDSRRSLQRQALERLIEREILYQAATRDKTKNSEEALEQLREQFSKSELENMEAQLAAVGIDRGTLDAELLKDLAIRQLLESLPLSKSAATDQAALDYYRNHRDQFTSPLEIHLQQILFKIKGTESEADLQLSKEKASKLRQELVSSPDSFTSLAISNTEGPNRTKGGDLGFLTENQVPPQIWQSLKTIRLDEISDVLKSDIGFHIFRVKAKRGGEVLDFEKAKPQITHQLTEAARQNEIQKLINKLRQKTRVIVYLK